MILVNKQTLYRNAVMLIGALLIISQGYTQDQSNCNIVKHFDLNGIETVHSSSISKDSFIYIAGSVKRFSNEGAFLIKTNQTGDILWSRVISGVAPELYRRVIATSDSGCITTGYSGTYTPSPTFAAIVIKWDKNGNKQWARSFNTNSQYGDVGHSITQCSDGGFLISAIHDSYGFVTAGILIKTDKAGNSQWIKRYPFFEGLDIESAYEASDGYIISGDYLYNGNTIYRALVFKVSKESGDVQLIKSWTVDGKSAQYNLLHKRPGGYYLNSHMLATVQGGGDVKHLILKLNENLDVDSAIRIDHAISKNKSYTELSVLADGSFIGAMGGDGLDGDMYKIGPDGIINWKTRIGGTGTQQLNSVASIKNDQAFVSGVVGDAAARDILWIRVNTTGNSNACNFQASDAVISTPNVTAVNFSFGIISNMNPSTWVTFEPSIEVNQYTVTYSCIEDCKPLPLVVKNFQGTFVDKKYNLLKFITLNEVNVASIVVERSYNGISFVQIAKLQPKGLASENRYEFSDKFLNSAERKFYYRLKIIDRNGNESYSSVIAILAEMTVANVSIYPNPAKDFVQLQLSTNISESIFITVIDALGKQILKQRTRLSRGDNAIELNIKGLKTGLYFVSFTSNGNKYNCKLLVE